MRRVKTEAPVNCLHAGFRLLQNVQAVGIKNFLEPTQNVRCSATPQVEVLSPTFAR